MKKGIKVWSDYDPTGMWVLHIEKQKGTLSVEEIKQAAMEYEQDFYMLVIKAMNEEVGQYYTVDDLEGDFVTLYRADDFFKFREK